MKRSTQIFALFAIAILVSGMTLSAQRGGGGAAAVAEVVVVAQPAVVVVVVAHPR